MHIPTDNDQRTLNVVSLAVGVVGFVSLVVLRYLGSLGEATFAICLALVLLVALIIHFSPRVQFFDLKALVVGLVTTASEVKRAKDEVLAKSEDLRMLASDMVSLTVWQFATQDLISIDAEMKRALFQQIVRQLHSRRLIDDDLAAHLGDVLSRTARVAEAHDKDGEYRQLISVIDAAIKARQRGRPRRAA
ncbi:MAG: hypothetical protein NTY23_12120 [Chloroflexi bacterium]|nr:hypothetical protein [Chloroflexota bacterium]